MTGTRTSGSGALHPLSANDSHIYREPETSRWRRPPFVTALMRADSPGLCRRIDKMTIHDAEKPHVFKPGKSSKHSLGPLCKICDASPIHPLHKRATRKLRLRGVTA